MHRPRLALTALAVATVSLVTAVLPSGAQPSSTAPAVTSPAATPVRFDFKDPKGVNAIGFFLDSELEPIMGMGSGVSGVIDYDPAHPESFTGSIALSASGLSTSNPRMTGVLHGADWLDVSRFLSVDFRFDRVERAVRVDERSARLQVAGTLSLRGISMPRTVEITATHVPDGAARRGAAKSGDLLVLRSNFSVDRAAFGIKPDDPGDKVARTIDINVAIVGYSQP